MFNLKQTCLKIPSITPYPPQSKTNLLNHNTGVFFSRHNLKTKTKTKIKWKKKNNTQYPPWNLVTYKTTCSKVSDNKVMKPENPSMNEIRFQQNTVLYSWKE